MIETLINKIEADDISAVIVTFFPDGKFIERLESILSQVKKVVIVNNALSCSFVLSLESFLSNNQVTIIQNLQNLGIAKALNQGIACAISEGYKWVWIFDQDTLVPPEVLHRLEICYNEISRHQKVGLIAPNFYDQGSGRYGIAPDKSGNYFDMPSVISSGSLIRIDVFSEIGWFNEKFFIDCVDDEYCLRMREKKYKIILVKDAIINHAIGAGVRHNFFNNSITTTNHSPVRRYFWSRNGFSLVFRYMSKEPRLALGILKSHLLTILTLLIFEDQKIKKLKYLLLGIFDALTNKFDRSITISGSN